LASVTVTSLGTVVAPPGVVASTARRSGRTGGRVDALTIEIARGRDD
jgi:hypothetical protein